MPTLNISGTLRSGTTGLPNKTINIYIAPSGSPYPSTPTVSTTTGSGGAFSASYVVDFGTYNVKAVFPGDDMYKPSEAEALNVDARASTTITVSVTVS